MLRGTCEFPDLDEKVPEMILEERNVLIQVEESRHRDLYLIVCEVGEGCFQQVCHEALKEEENGSI
jgi:hypothetical protein